MPDYGLVARQINRLTNQIRGEREAGRADKLAMSNLGLQRAQFGLQQRTAQGQQDIALAKAKREQWLAEPVTIGQAIDTHPKWAQEQKDAIKMSIPENVRSNFLNHITTRSQLNSAIEKLQASQSEKEYRDKLLALKGREVNAKEKGTKDTRGGMQKDVEYIQGVRGVPAEKALDEYLSNKTLGERIRLFNNELTNLSKDLDFQDLEDTEKAKRVDKLRKAYRITDVMEVEDQPQKRQLTREKAIEYMRMAKGDKSAAIKMAQDDGYSVYEDMTK